MYRIRNKNSYNICYFTYVFPIEIFSFTWLEFIREQFDMKLIPKIPALFVNLQNVS